MIITYIYHSCFTLETDDCALIFDYYTHGCDIRKIIGAKKYIYVFSSHIHGDHFNPEIFTWTDINENIKYILSFDISKSGVPKIKDVIFLSEGESFNDEYIKVKAYGSTDCGVSFWVETEGKSIFHSGDLNNWHWNEQVTQDEANIYNELFLNKLKEISHEQKYADVVFFPVDPRLGRDYRLGGEQFIREIKTKLFVPMHFWDDYEKANAFKTISEENGCGFFSITKKGDNISL